MKNIAILGSSLVSAKVIEEIRNSDRESSIALFLLENNLPYDRSLIPSLISKKIQNDEIYSQNKEFYETNNVNIISGNKITRINLNRSRIFTENKEQFTYDILIITDMPNYKFPDIKGINKQGSYGLRKLSDIQEILNNIGLADTIAIQTDSLSGLQTALALRETKKEILMITSGKGNLYNMFEPEVIDWIFGILQERGVNLVRDNEIVEMLGEGDIRAVRLRSEKVFGAQMIIFSEADYDVRLFSESNLDYSKRIPVNMHLKSNLDNVFIADNLGSKERDDNIPEDFIPGHILEDQARIIAASITGNEISIQNDPIVRSLDIEGLNIKLIGNVCLNANVSARQTFNRESGTYKKIFINNNIISGAILINADHEIERISKLIENSVEISSIEDKVVDERENSDNIGQQQDSDAEVSECSAEINHDMGHEASNY